MWSRSPSGRCGRAKCSTAKAVSAFGAGRVRPSGRSPRGSCRSGSLTTCGSRATWPRAHPCRMAMSRFRPTTPHCGRVARWRWRSAAASGLIRPMDRRRVNVTLPRQAIDREDIMIRSTRRQAIIGAAATAVTGMTGRASAQTPLKVIVFAGMSNLAQFAALAQGFYTKRGLAVELVYTPNSTELRDGLAAGRYQIAHAGVDNAVEQVETAKVDLFIFMGGNNGFNNLIAQPE